MIAEIAVTATLSAGLLGYMIGRSGKAAAFAANEFRILQLERRRDEWKESSQQMTKNYFAIKSQLDAIKRQRSENTRRGNITKRLKREAAKVSA